MHLIIPQTKAQHQTTRVHTHDRSETVEGGGGTRFNASNEECASAPAHPYLRVPSLHPSMFASFEEVRGAEKRALILRIPPHFLLFLFADAATRLCRLRLALPASVPWKRGRFAV